ncbi:MAG TPA: PilZ domain-containing protein [Pyrinomonadaceae bacterium]|jgi:hypothetical protein|nr:PilZ domain-containing protein [Pyrinomonadaceae bacterium]
MFSAWDIINSNRRLNPRHKVRLMASVSLVLKESEESEAASVLAYTRDLSRDGLAIVLPSARMGCHDLSAGEYQLSIILAISAESSVRLTARLIHCEIFEDESGAGYLVGVRIEDLNAEDRTLYDEFIGGLH